MQANYALRELLATYRDAEDLINIGAYVDGSNPKIDRAKKMVDPILSFLRQSIDEAPPFEDVVDQITRMFR